MKKRYAYFVSELGLGDQIFYIHLYVNSRLHIKNSIVISTKIYSFIHSLYPNNNQIICQNTNRVNYEPLDINHLYHNFIFNDDDADLASNNKVIGFSWKSFNSQHGDKKDIPIVDILKSLKGSSYQYTNLQYGDIKKEKEELDKHGIHLQEASKLPFYENIIHHASVIRAVDVVITSSNIVAHIAGIINKRTILILPSSFPDHPYWLKVKNKHSYYYPNTLIYRMDRNEGWILLKSLIE